MSGVFVKLFRNLEEWQKREVELGKAQSKFEYESEKRKALAKAAGLPEEEGRAQFNSEIDPALFYSSFDCDSEEFKIWHDGCTNNQIRNANAEEFRRARLTNPYPNEVLEEVALTTRLGLFFGGRSFLPNSDEFKERYRLHHGFRGNQCYLIAFWGEQSAFDEIQSKLQKLAENRAKAEKEAAEKQAEVAVSAEAQSQQETMAVVENRCASSMIYGGLALGVLVAVCIYAVTIVVGSAMTDADAERMLKWVPGQTSGQSQPVSVSEFCPHGFSIRWFSPCRTASDLPNGKVVRMKWAVPCIDHGHHNLVWLFDGLGDLCCDVSRELWDQLKIGDEIPPPKPAEKPKPRERASREF